MKAVAEFLIRVSAFVRKEIVEALRQPRLVLILILGPFLVLLLFGLGYTNVGRTMRIMLVIPQESTIREEIENLAAQLGGSVELTAIVPTTQEAIAALDRGEVDIVMVTPEDPYRDILDSEQSLFEVYHHEIDPLEVLYVNTLNDVLVQTINRYLLTSAVDQAKTASVPIQSSIEEMIQDTAQTREDLADKDLAALVEDIDVLVGDVLELNRALAAGLALYEGAQSLAGEQEFVSPFDRLARIDELAEALSSLDAEGLDLDQTSAQIAEMQRELDAIQAYLSEFGQIDSRVLVTPFAGTVVSRTLIELGPIDFYVPGVIALLLQHMAITLAALSIVRERRGGSVELFRAAPVSALETLLGKYISFLLLGGVLAAVLTALIILALKVPMLGSWADYALAILLLLLMALGAGFVISVISETDTQAVQYSMIALLASVFFSGFFIALHRFLPAVRIISALLPATYGTGFLQEIMLRGRSPDLSNVLLALGMAGVFFAIAWWRLGRLMARE
jgi:ABC-2 type transport system permease protein